jgi:transcriptional regulator with XRE-family HTH domain
MAKIVNKRLRESVSKNLRELMGRRDWSQEQTARKAGVSQRHISNMLSLKTSASFETLEAVGAAFGIPGWMLTLSDVPVDLLDSQDLPLIVSFYRNAGPDGRALILRLAERESHYNQQTQKVLPLRKPAVG